MGSTYPHTPGHEGPAGQWQRHVAAEHDLVARRQFGKSPPDRTFAEAGTDCELCNRRSTVLTQFQYQLAVDSVERLPVMALIRRRVFVSHRPVCHRRSLRGIEYLQFPVVSDREDLGDEVCTRTDDPGYRRERPKQEARQESHVSDLDEKCQVAWAACVFDAQYVRPAGKSFCNRQRVRSRAVDFDKSQTRLRTAMAGCPGRDPGGAGIPVTAASGEPR